MELRLPLEIFLPGESHGQRSLAGYGRVAESDMTEVTLHTPMHTFLNMVLLLEHFSGAQKVD